MIPEAYSKRYLRSKMECFGKIDNAKKLLSIFAKCSILDV